VQEAAAVVVATPPSAAVVAVADDKVTSTTAEKGPKAKGDTATKDKKEKEPSYVGKVLAVQRNSLPLLLLGCVFAVGSGGSPLFGFRQLTAFFGALFQLSGTLVRDSVIEQVTAIGVSIAATIGFFTLDSTCFGICANRLTCQLRKHAFTAFMRQDIGFFDVDSNSAGELTAFLSEKVTLMESLTGGSAQAVFRVVAAIAIFLVFIFKDGPWQLALAMLFVFPAVMGVMGIVINSMAGDEIKDSKGQENTSKSALAEKSAGKLLGEVVISIRTVASFCAEQRFYEEYCQGVDHVRALEQRNAFKVTATIAGVFPIMLVLMSGMHYYIGWLINNTDTTFEEGMVPMFLMFGIMLPVMSATMGVKDIATANHAAARFFATTARVSPIDPSSVEGQTLKDVSGTVAVRDVAFAYPSAPEHLVCKGYSITIPAGQTVALCGPSGSGKSTIIQLIERFYDPQGGVVMLDGVDIKTLNVRWLRSQLGLVGQEPVLFQGSVTDNIRYGKPGASQEEVEEAAKSANAHTFITTVLNDGYSTDVGLRGGKLSGGQKQRVAIARAIIKKPAVLLLDEATSALDNESERVVQVALDEIMTKQKRTTIVIAHRLSTIRNADKIAVISEGAVVEEGTHDELLQNSKGMYFSLVLAQSGSSSEAVAFEA